MSKRTIAVEPYGGLGNRMLVTASGMALAEDTDSDMILIWHSTPSLNCAFGNLFNIPDIIQDVTTCQPDLSNFKLFNRQKIEQLRRNESDLRCEAENGNLYIRTCCGFYNYHDQLKELEPIKELNETIDDIWDQFGACTIGMHIRRGDNKYAKENSPTQLYHEVIESLDPQKDIKFFLATDSQEEEKAMKEFFSNRASKLILYDKKKWSRNSRKGVQSALIEMYCLSKCDTIIKSYRSSFSYVAAIIGSVPKITVKKP